MDDPSLNAPAPVREGVGTDGSGRNWPMNSWLALYRRANGDPAALHNRCPHRWAPLSLGEVAAAIEARRRVAAQVAAERSSHHRTDTATHASQGTH
jgi:hypothetical protein